MIEVGAHLHAKSAPPTFVTAPVLETPPVVVEYVQPTPVAEDVTPAPTVTCAHASPVVEYVFSCATAVTAMTAAPTVGVPQVQFIDKVVDMPVIMQRQMPAIQKVQKTKSNPAGSKADVTWTTAAVTLGDEPSMFESIPQQHTAATTHVGQEVFRNVPVPVMQPIDVSVPVPHPFVQTVGKFVEAPQVQMVERPVTVCPITTQEVVMSVSKSDVEETANPVPQVMTQGVLVPVAVPKTLDSPHVELIDKSREHSCRGTETGPIGSESSEGRGDAKGAVLGRSFGHASRHTNVRCP